MPPSSAAARKKPRSRSVAAASVEILPNSQNRDDARGRIGQHLVDAQLELTARQVLAPGTCAASNASFSRTSSTTTVRRLCRCAP